MSSYVILALLDVVAAQTSVEVPIHTGQGHPKPLCYLGPIKKMLPIQNCPVLSPESLPLPGWGCQSGYIMPEWVYMGTLYLLATPACGCHLVGSPDICCFAGWSPFCRHKQVAAFLSFSWQVPSDLLVRKAAIVNFGAPS